MRCWRTSSVATATFCWFTSWLRVLLKRWVWKWGFPHLVAKAEIVEWVVKLFIISMIFDRFVQSLSPCLCDGWGKYSGILNCHQEASRMGGEICCSIITYFLSRMPEMYLNLVLSFLYSWSISCFLKLAFYFV